MSTLSELAGHVRVCPRAPRPLSCDRPILRPGVLGRLLRGCSLEAAPQRLRTLFAVCGDVHHFTARQAISAANGGEPVTEPAGRWLEGVCMREHALQLGLELPGRMQLTEAPADGSWLRGLPDASSAALAGFLEARLWGMSASEWCARFPDARTLAEAARERAMQPGPWAWLLRAAELGSGMTLPLRPLPRLDADTLAQLGAALACEPHGCVYPTHQGSPREVGAWARLGDGDAQLELDAWQLVAARLLELARLCAGQHGLRHGARALGVGEAVAFSELSRGVVLHWVKLDPARPDRIHDYRVLAPTEWNFHPDGALARVLATAELDPARLRLLVHALDPCVAVRFDEVGRA